MSATQTQIKNPTTQDIKAAKKKKRTKVLYTLMNGVLIYSAVVAGVVMTELALDIRETETLQFFQNWSWLRLGVSAVIAGGFMTKFESGGDLVGKQKNLFRRVSHSFGQGAALRGMIEWLAMLFAMTR